MDKVCQQFASCWSFKLSKSRTDSLLNRRARQWKPENELERALRDTANDHKTGHARKANTGTRRRSVLTSVLQSLRLTLPVFTLGQVLDEVNA